MPTRDFRSQALRSSQRNAPFNPVPSGKPVVTDFSTPNLNDRVIVVHKDARHKDFELPEKGSTYPGPYTDKLTEDFKFATAVPSPQNVEELDLFYLNERENQDEYNFSIEYPTGDINFPKVTRNYVFLRDSVPVNPVNDPVFAGLTLVEFAQVRLDNAIFDALFVGVQRVYEKLPGDTLTTKSLGQRNLIPEKYRRLIRTIETNQPVPADYVFPSGLTGDQSQIELVQESILRARLKIISEVINTDEAPLQGSRTGEFGNLIINEEIVEEGTPALSGELVQDSQVTPLGNGKSIRITILYPSNLFDLQKVRRTVGQQNLIPEKYRRLIRTVETEKPVPVDYTFPAGLTGDQTFIEFAQRSITEARLKIIEEVINTDEAPLQGSQTGEFGNLIVLEEIVDEGTPALSGELIQESRVTPLGNGKSVRITLKYPTNLFDLQKVKRTIGQENLIPQKYRRLIRTVETEKPVPVDYTFPSGLTGDQTFIEFAQRTITEARLKITEEIINTDESPLPGAETDDYGQLIITEEIVDDGTLALEGFLIKRSQVTPLGNGKSIRITVKYPTDLADVELQGTRIIDDRTGILPVQFVRKIVPAGTVGGYAGGISTEIEPQDKWRSISVATEIPSDLSSLNQVTYAVINHAFPDQLTNASVLWSHAAYTAGATAMEDFDIGLRYELIEGYRGPCEGRITDTYTNGPPSSIPAITKFFPRGQQIGFEYYFASSRMVRAVVRIFQIPVSLHPTIALAPSFFTSDTITATSPTALPAAGTYIVIDVQPEPWRFGIWRTRTIEVKVP